MEVLLRQPSAGCLYPWGLQLQKVDRPDSGTCLVVSQIYPWGLVAHKNAWLAFLPVAWEQQLQPGDRILRANGETEVNAIARVLLCSEVIQVHLFCPAGPGRDDVHALHAPNGGMAIGARGPGPSRRTAR